MLTGALARPLVSIVALLCVMVACPLLAAPMPPEVARVFVSRNGDMPSLPLTAVASDPGDGDVIFVGADGFVFKSIDAGKTWKTVLSFPRGARQQASVDGATGTTTISEDVELQEDIDLDDPEYAESFLEEDEDIDVPFFDDGQTADELADGSTLTTVRSFRLRPGVREIAFAAAKFKLLFVATPRGLFRSDDLGESFQIVELPGGPAQNDVRDISIGPQGKSLLIATRGGAMLSLDGGQTYRRVGPLNVNAQAMTVRIVGTQFWLGLDSGLFLSTDGGGFWERQLLSGASPTLGILDLADDTKGGLWVGTRAGLFQTMPVGSEGAGPRAFDRVPSLGRAIVDVVNLPKGGKSIWVSVRNQNVVRLDRMTMAPMLTTDRVPARDISGIASAAHDPNLVFVATERGLFVSSKSTVRRRAKDENKQTMDNLRLEPDFARVAAAGLRVANVAPGDLISMKNRSRWAGLGPRVSLIYRVNYGRGLRLNVADDDDFDDNRADLLDALSNTPGGGLQHGAFVLFQWNDLNSIWFADDEPRILGLNTRARLAQERVLSRLTTLFSARQKILASPAPATGAYERRLQQTIELQDLAAQIDGLTDGAFTRLRNLRRRSAVPSDGGGRENARNSTDTSAKVAHRMSGVINDEGS